MALPFLLSISAIPKDLKATSAFVTDHVNPDKDRLDSVITLQKFHPWRVDLLESKAEIYLEMGMFDDAIDSYERASQKGALSVNGALTLGTALLNSLRTEEAIELWSDYLSQNPSASEIYPNLFEVQIKTGDLPGAIITLEKWIAVDTNPHLRILYAEALAIIDAERASAIINNVLEDVSQIDEDWVLQLKALLDRPYVNNDQAYQLTSRRTKPGIFGSMGTVR